MKILKLDGAPNAAAIGALGTFAVFWLYFVRRHIAHFGLYGDVLGFGANAQFIHAAAAVLTAVGTQSAAGTR